MRKLGLLVVPALLLVLAAVAWARPGDRDTAGFTDDGYVELNTTGDRFRDVVFMPDGDIVAVGSSLGSELAPQDPAIAVRYASDGLQRSAFRLPSGTGAEAAGVAVDSEGRVVVAVETANGRVHLMRLLGTALTPDPDWRGGTSSTVTVDTDAAHVVGLGITPDDRPVVVATYEDSGDRTTILRWTEGGQLDDTLDGDGRIDLGSVTQPITASDMLVDATGRVVIARGTSAGRNLLRVADSLPGTTLAVPDAVETSGMQVALAGTDLLVAGATGVSGSIEVRVMRFNDAGAPDETFGIRTATVTPGYTTSTPGPSDVTALADGRIVTVLPLKEGGVQRSALVRLNADGTPDETFAAGDGGHFAVDDLDNASRNLEPNALAAVAEGKVVVAGTSGTTPDERAYAARYGIVGDPPEASLSVAYRPIGNPASVRAYARPGQPVDFTATATDPDGTIVGYAWDPEGDGTFTDSAPSPTFNASFPVPRVYDAAVRVRDSDGITETAFAEVRVQANVPPAVEVRRGYDADPAGSPSSFSADRPVTFKVSATDADGRVARYQLDLDGQPGFEIDGATGARAFDNPGPAIVNVRVTDDEGGFTDERVELTITEPPCTGEKELVVGRLRAFAQGWQRVVENQGQANEKVIDTACEPPPPTFTSVFDLQDQFDSINLADRPSVNGIYFSDPDLLQIVRQQNERPRVVWAASRVEVPAPGGTRFRLVDGLATGRWKLEDNTLKNVSPHNAVFGGLKVGALGSGGTIPLPALGQAKFSVYPALPPVFGGVTADTPFVWTTNAPQQRQIGAGDCFNVKGAALPGLDFLPGGQGVKICRRADDPDAFDFEVKIDLAAFDLPAFDGLPKLDASGGINDGELTGLAAEVTPFTPGIPIIGPIFLESIDFQLVLDESSLVDLNCVNGVGVKIISNQRARDLNRQIAIDAGLTGAQLEEFVRIMNSVFTDFRVDYGQPSSALCGGAKFYAGFNPVRLAEGSLSLGVVEYSDNRPDAFRVIGRARIIEVFNGEAELSVYTSGFVEMRAGFHATFFELVRLNGDLLLQVDAPRGRYNAEAGIEGCVIPVDICAGIRAIISSRGLGGCLELSFLGADWNPGMTHEYGEGTTPYAWGCDLSDVRVTFNSGESSTIITPVVPNRRAAWTRAPVAQIAQEKHEETITVKPGMPGVYIGVRGQGDQLAKFTLTGPNGERISVDGTGDPTKPIIAPNLVVGYDERFGVTNVLIGSPAAGKWTLTPDAGSVPIVEVVGADGLGDPEVSAKVTGKGHQRVLRYEVEPRKGQVVTFREDGPTGNQWLGQAKAGKGKLRFDTAVGEAEKRTIVAIVEQDGMPRDELDVARFSAPATQPAGRIARTRVRRRGTKVTLRWLPSSGAKSYRVRARLSDGRVVVRETRRRKLVLTRVARRTTGRFTIAGIDAVGEPGRAKQAKLKPAKQKKRKKKSGA